MSRPRSGRFFAFGSEFHLRADAQVRVQTAAVLDDEVLGVNFAFEQAARFYGNDAGGFEPARNVPWTSTL